MARTNPEVERLTRENAILRKALDTAHADPGDLPVAGCGDHSCVVAHTTGMSTNGGCRCEAPMLRRALAYFRRLGEFRQETIRVMRAAPLPDAGAEDERAAIVAFLRREASDNYDDGTAPHKALTDCAAWIEQGLHASKAD